MGVAIDVVRVALNTSTGTQDITGSLGGLTPKAAIFIVTSATADGIQADHSNISYGAATGASNRWAISMSNEDGQGTMDSHRYALDTACIRLSNPGTTTIDGEADFSTFITNGVRINITTAFNAPYLATVILFAGTDVSAHADNAALGDSVDNAVDITAPSFEPEQLFTCIAHTRAAGQAGGRFDGAWGIVHNDGAGGITQRCHAFNQNNGGATAEMDGRVTETYGIMAAENTGALNWGGEFGTFDSNGFTVTTKVGGGNNTSLFYLALSFGGAVNSWVGTVDTPTSTGDDPQTGPGFTPQFVYGLGNHMEAIDTAYNNSPLAGPTSVMAFTDTNEFSNTVMAENGVGTSNTKSVSDNIAIEIPDDDGAAGLTASFVSMDTNGWTLDYSAVEANAKKLLFLAIEEEAPAAAIMNQIQFSNLGADIFDGTIIK